jgi:hypothetical protein
MTAGEIVRGVRAPGGLRKVQVSISPEGSVLAPGTEAFFERIGYANPDFDASDYVVRNLGFISVVRRSRDRMTVRLRPSLVSPKALDAALKILVNQDFKQGEIQRFEMDWVSEIWPNDPAMLHRLVDLCEKAQQPLEPRFGAKPLDINRISEDNSNPLKPLYQKWRVSSSIFDDTTLPFLINYGLDYRLSVVTAPRVGEPLRFQFFGEGFKFYDDRQRMRVIGAPIADQPDADYGRWLAEQYAAVVESGRPSLDYVTAHIQPDSGPSRRSRYERLLLPWRTNDDKVIVTCASVLISMEEINEQPSRDLTLYRHSLRDEAPEVRQELAAGHAH